MLFNDAAEIHPIQLITAENEQVIPVVIQEVQQVFADGVGGALVPRGVGKGLFRRENFHEAAGEMVELVGLRNVPVQRGGIELGQQVNAAQAGVDAVGNGDVHQPVFAGERHGGFGAFLGEREKARALAAAHDDAQDIAGVERLSSGLCHKNLYQV